MGFKFGHGSMISIKKAVISVQCSVQKLCERLRVYCVHVADARRFSIQSVLDHYSFRFFLYIKNICVSPVSVSSLSLSLTLLSQTVFSYIYSSSAYKCVE